jgi:hypothetical protein
MQAIIVLLPNSVLSLFFLQFYNFQINRNPIEWNSSTTLLSYFFQVVHMDESQLFLETVSWFFLKRASTVPAIW